METIFFYSNSVGGHWKTGNLFIVGFLPRSSIFPKMISRLYRTIGHETKPISKESSPPLQQGHINYLKASTMMITVNTPWISNLLQNICHFDDLVNGISTTEDALAFRALVRFCNEFFLLILNDDKPKPYDRTSFYTGDWCS